MSKFAKYSFCINQLFTTLEPNEEEEKTIFWRSIESEGSPLKLQLNLDKQMPSQSNLVQSNPNQDNLNRDNQNQVNINCMDAPTRQKFIDDLGSNMYEKFRQDRAFIEEIGNYSADRVIVKLADVLPGYMDYMKNQESLSNNMNEVVNFFNNFIVYV